MRYRTRQTAITGQAASGDPASSPAPLLVPSVNAELEAPETAAHALNLVLDYPQWVHRRVEKLEFVDERTIRRWCSMDASIPESAPKTGANKATLVPLTLLHKEPLSHLDVLDADGTSLPVLTTGQNGALAGAMLCELARGALNQAPEAQLAADLREIAAAPKQAAKAAYDRVFNSGEATAAAVVHGHGTQRARLADRHVVSILARRLSENFILWAVLPPSATGRIIVKFSYDERLNLRDAHEIGVPRLLAASIGWLATPFEISTPSAVDCESYHFEVEAPEGANVQEVEVTLRPPEETDPPITKSAVGGAPCVHVHVGGVKEGYRASARIAVRATSGDWLETTLFAAFLTALVLGLFAWRFDQLGAATNAGGLGTVASALLLGLTGIFATVLLRRDEHALTTKLLRWLRRLAAVSGLLPFLTALVFVFWPSGLPGRDVWVAFAGLGVAIFMVVAISYLLART